MRIVRMMMVAFAMTMCAVSASADVYTDGLNKLMESGVLGQFDAISASGLSNQNASAESLKSEMVELIAPYYRENMSEKSFKKYVEFYTKPEVAQAMKSTSAQLGKISNELEGAMRPVMMTIMQGGNVEPLKKEACSAEMDALINSYMNVTMADKLMKAVVKGMGDMVTSKSEGMPEDQKVMMAKMFGGITDYVNTNVGTIFHNILAKGANIDDLKTLNTVKDQSFYAEYAKTNEAFISHLPEIMENILSKIANN